MLDLSEFVATHRVDIINASLNALESYEPSPTFDEVCHKCSMRVIILAVLPNLSVVYTNTQSEYGLVVHVRYEPTRQATPEKRFSLEDAHVMSFKEVCSLASNPPLQGTILETGSDPNSRAS